MTFRQAVLKIHLFLGLLAGVFLLILGLTGSIMAFEGDITHWLHSGFFYVTPAAQALPEAELIRIVEQRFAPARVHAVQVARAKNLARVMQLTGGSTVTINPYNGAILGSRKDDFSSDRVLGYIHQIHLRLAPDPRSAPNWSPTGKFIVSLAGLFLCLLVPTGLILFIRTARSRVEWRGSWFRTIFDLHHVVGIYSALFLFIAALTGVMIGFDFGEKGFYMLAHSAPPARSKPVSSSPRAPGARALSIDRAIEIAHSAISDATVAGYFMPAAAGDTFTVLMRVPEDTSESVHSSVAVDQFSGQILQLRNFLTDSQGYRLIRMNRSIHTGDIWGTPAHIVVSLSSLMLVVMVLSGVVIWWKKLAV